MEKTNMTNSIQDTKKKQLSILLSIICVIALFLGATYAWFSHNRVTDTDSVYAKTNEDTVDLYVSSYGGSEFKNSHEADIVQVNKAEKKALMPESTADLDTFLYASVSTPDKLQLSRDTKGAYYYHGRVYIKAKTTGDHKGQKMTVYLDGSDSAGGDILQSDNQQMLDASRVGLTVGGADPVILNLDNQKADEVASYAGGQITYVADPSNYVNKYLLKVSGGSATRPERSLMTIDLDKEYPVDIYYYMEGCDEDCTDEIAEEKVTLHLAFYGVLE